MRVPWVRRLGPLVLLIVSCLAITPSAHAQIATPDLASLPEATAPFGLHGVVLPVDEEGIHTLFAQFPATLAGESRQPTAYHADRLVAVWGEPEPGLGSPLTLTALSFVDGDFFPADFAAGLYVAMASGTGDAQAVAFGRDGDLVWIQSEIGVGVEGEKPGTPAASGVLYTLAWGTIDSPWLFTAAADSPEGLRALVATFVDASATAVEATPPA